MNNEVYEELKKLITCFPDAYINRHLEFVLIPKTNTYFHLEGCLTREDVISNIVLAHQLDLDVTECLSIAYEEIKNRKGKMVNGTFVKEEDL